jgi:hypothetical protein
MSTYCEFSSVTSSHADRVDIADLFYKNKEARPLQEHIPGLLTVGKMPWRLEIFSILRKVSM